MCVFVRSMKNTKWSNLDRTKGRLLNQFFNDKLKQLVSSVSLVENCEQLSEQFPNVNKLFISRKINVQMMNQMHVFTNLKEVHLESSYQVEFLTSSMYSSEEIKKIIKNCKIEFPYQNQRHFMNILYTLENLMHGGSGVMIIRYVDQSKNSQFLKFVETCEQCQVHILECLLDDNISEKWWLKNKDKILSAFFVFSQENNSVIFQFLENFLEENQSIQCLRIKERNGQHEKNKLGPNFRQFKIKIIEFKIDRIKRKQIQ
eukprot:TRINITY_DN2822_c0_g1_i6.p1 TRINITY_DN2822_c0_g1~~TRINITY_DN2822_c0_g1_i6.p1  ORF type:complete len:289 (-),score=3.76 TRINITY_DN2822_c0_g1_i6:622-1398(-)